MAARTAHDVIARLRKNPPTLWVDGEQVTDPTTHPTTANGAASLAALYDLQHRPDLIDTMTFESPTTGDRVGMSFLVPESREDLERRSAMHQVWADAHLGFMGRAPDYLNVNVMAAGMAADYFAQCRPEFGRNMANYFELVRENDLALTHALTNPQVDRSKRDSELDDPFTALGVVRETSDGIIVRGARMLATLPISDEILIFPSTVLQRGDDMVPYAMAFAIPNDTDGLIFQCREPLDRGRSHRDHPLGSRFDEMDAMVYFDDVLVPWERVFLMGDVELANGAYGNTGAVLHMAHQVVNLKIAKTEAILGTMQAAVDMTGSGGKQHVQEMIAEAIIVLEIMKALKVASEAGATVNEYGVMTPFARTARRSPQLLPEDVPAARGDPAARHVERADHDPDRGRPRRSDGPEDPEVPGIRGWRCRGTCPTDAPGLGHDDQRLRWPAGPLRELLLRRSGPHEDGALRRVRPQRLRRPGQGLRRRQSIWPRRFFGFRPLQPPLPYRWSSRILSFTFPAASSAIIRFVAKSIPTAARVLGAQTTVRCRRPVEIRPAFQDSPN